LIANAAATVKMVQTFMAEIHDFKEFQQLCMHHINARAYAKKCTWHAVQQVQLQQQQQQYLTKSLLSLADRPMDSATQGHRTVGVGILVQLDAVDIR
jgi:hypothetical protein